MRASSNNTVKTIPAVTVVHRGPLGVVTVPAAQVWEQEQQGKRERPDKRSNPRPDLKVAPSTLGHSAGNIHRSDRSDKSDQGNSVHDARSNAALRQSSHAVVRATPGLQQPPVIPGPPT